MNIKEICKQINLKPAKIKGQNFLIDKNILQKIINLSDIKKNDLVLEIGPGFGILTKELCKKSKKVIAVEKDKKLFGFLNKNLNITNLKIINSDILKFDINKIFNKNQDYKIIANIPYKITSPILWKFLHQTSKKPKSMFLMIQKEVADRITAKRGDMNLLSVLCQFYCDIKIFAKVSQNSFWPKPKVQSVLIEFILKKHLPDLDYIEFFKFIKSGFSKKRKMLKTNISNHFEIENEKVLNIFNKLKIKPNTRAQELNINNWVDLFKQIKAKYLT